MISTIATIKIEAGPDTETLSVLVVLVLVVVIVFSSEATLVSIEETLVTAKSSGRTLVSSFTNDVAVS